MRWVPTPPTPHGSVPRGLASQGAMCVVLFAASAVGAVVTKGVHLLAHIDGITCYPVVGPCNTTAAR